MGNQTPVISVIVPVFNAAGTLDRTLNSLRAQTLGEWEAICIDDGSTDESRAILRAWASGDERVRVVHAAEPGRNRGVAAARNAGLACAAGEFVHFLDSDDTVEPDAFAMLTSLCRASGLEGAAASYEVVNSDGEPLLLTQIDVEQFGLDELMDRVFLWTSQHIVKRACLSGVRFDESFETYEDLDVWLRLAERGVRWAVDQRRVASYYARPGSLSRRSLSMLPDAQRAWANAFERSRRGAEKVRLLDDSEARCDRVLRWAAISNASRSAMCFGKHGPEIAERQFESAMGSKVICPETLGRMGYYQLVLGLGIKPGRNDNGQWRRRLEAWWARCQERGWLESSGRRHASEVLDMLVLGHEAIASEIVEIARQEAALGLEIIGYGRNGRLLARRALEAGLRVRARDDHASDQGEWGVERVHASAQFAPGWLSVISPLTDASLAMRYPHALRWREVPRRVLENVATKASLTAQLRTGEGE